MRAAVLPAPHADLAIEEIPIPQPRAGEVLVKVAGCGVCHTDLHVIKAEVAFPTPCVLGHEISGTVVAVADDTDAPAVGSRVVGAFIMPCGSCRFCARGRDDLCERFFALNRLRGCLYDGTTRLRRGDGQPLWMYSMAGLAEYCVVPATGVFALPDELPIVESAVYGCSILTAYGAVRHAADLRLGETVAVVAIGGVGLNLVQLAHAFGARQIIAVDISGDRLKAATDLGATSVVNGSEQDVVSAVRELTDGEGVDVAFEALGRPQTFEQAFDLVRDGGRMVAIGIAAGPTTASIGITRLVRRGIRVIGSYGGRTRSDMPEILRLATEGLIRAERMVTERVPLAEANNAYQALERGQIVGRAVVTPSE
ncbi:MAG: zinc-binding dehydrogenase [Candidatus Dormibacteria bacterium]|jgi:S-(hydroxymethyl)glutathione dehydrogenase/alcohol dehydrogenase